MFKVDRDSKKWARRKRKLQHFSTDELFAISEIQVNDRRADKLNRKEKVKLFKSVKRERDQIQAVSLPEIAAITDYSKYERIKLS